MVKINVSDGLTRMTLAYFLDRKGVYDWMLDIRKHWGLSKKLVSSGDFLKWLNDYHPEMTFTKEAAQYYEDIVDKWEIRNSRQKVLSPEEQINERQLAYLNKIELEVELLMKKFGINHKYKNIITKAIACGLIEDGDVVDEKENFEYDFLLDSQELKFIVEKNYKGSAKNVKKKFDRDRKRFYKFRELRKTHGYADTIQKLADGANIDNDEIIQQLKRYRRFLKK